jgi:uncharacterized protein YcaQ
VESIANRAMRRFALDRQGFSDPTRSDFDKEALLRLIYQLAYVQLDSINVVERAHHMILFSRNRHYRREMLSELVERDRQLFEHWTHDACILPTSYYPHWQHRFEVARQRLTSPRWRNRLGPHPQKVLDAVRGRLDREGPLRTRDFADRGTTKRSSWWGWTEEKTALEFLWRSGELGISRREGFEKVYEPMEAVIPSEYWDEKIDWQTSVDWKCREALKRLGAATAVEIAGFWASCSTATVNEWLEAQRSAGGVVDVEVATVDGSRPRPRVALPKSLEELSRAPQSPRSMRLLSPFDPLIRDRKRTAWLFGFDYRIEVFIPAAKREYGYYVLPILEGERFTGRIDLKTHRKEGYLEVIGLWWEPGIRPSPARIKALDRCLARLARFVEVDEVRGLEQKRTRRSKLRLLSNSS